MSRDEAPLPYFLSHKNCKWKEKQKKREMVSYQANITRTMNAEKFEQVGMKNKNLCRTGEFGGKGGLKGTK